MPPLLNESGGAALKKSSSGGGSWVVVPVDDMFSDGDEKTWPADPTYESEDPSKYLEKLAKMWMQQTGEYKKGQCSQFFIVSVGKGCKFSRLS